MYVVNVDGSVQAVLAEEDYKKRPSIEAILEVLPEAPAAVPAAVPSSNALPAE